MGTNGAMIKTMNMKQLIMGVVIAMLSVCASAQKDVTRFLGIPVDGTKTEMIQKLKAKGFRPTTYDKETLEGEFNGRGVYVRVVTNNNKVWRIVVIDARNSDERAIQIRFNTLCSQFERNSKYLTGSAPRISDAEDISYEMTVNNKRYEASFYQQSSDMLTKTIDYEEMMNSCSKRSVWFKIGKEYGQYYIVMYYDNEYNMANGEDL